MRLRMPPELRESIEEAAKNNSRSLNAEIVYRLENSFSSTPSRKELPTAETAHGIVRAAREQLRETALCLAIEEVNEGLNLGLDRITFDFSPVITLEESPEDLFYSIITPTINTLKSKGYTVQNNKDGSITVSIF